MKQYFVTGTDTGVGKTLISALLTLLFSARYWKPIQTGLNDEIADAITIKNLTQLRDDFFYPSTYQFKTSLSPHESAKLENQSIDLSVCQLPTKQDNLIVEGAGGVFVPINSKETLLDLMQQLQLPVIIVARGTLGTLNHTLLTIEALRMRHIPLAGVVFNGDLNPHNQSTIESFGKINTLFHVPHFPCINTQIISQWVNEQQDTILARFS